MKTTRLFLALILAMMMILSGCQSFFQNDTTDAQGEVIPDIDSTTSQSAPYESQPQGDELAENITYQLYQLSNNEVLFELTNHNDEDFQQITLYATFKDQEGDIIAEREYYYKAITSGQKFYSFSTDLKEYEIDPVDCDITFEIEYNDKGYHNAIDSILLEADEAENFSIMANLTNTGSHTLRFVSAHTLFYRDGEIVGATERVASYLETNEVQAMEFLAPIDSEMKMVQYDDYDVVISQAYYEN